MLYLCYTERHTVVTASRFAVRNDHNQLLRGVRWEQLLATFTQSGLFLFLLRNYLSVFWQKIFYIPIVLEQNGIFRM